MNSTCSAKKLTESLTRPLAACTLALAITAPAHAALLAYDPIDGYSAGPIAGQAVQGTGFFGSWQAQNTTNSVGTGGLSYGDLVVSGNQHVMTDNGGDYLRVELDNPIGSGTVYVSVLASGALTDSSGPVWGPFFAIGGGINSTADVEVPRDGQTHFYVFKFDLGVVNDKSDDGVTIYTDADPAAAEPGSGTFVDLSGDGQWNGALTHIMLRGGWTGQWDELRVGTTWESVTPVVPEPSSLALIGLGGLCVLRRRRNG